MKGSVSPPTVVDYSRVKTAYLYAFVFQSVGKAH